jgi:hypothetical protein
MVLGGFCGDAIGSFCMTRLNSDGSRDATFNRVAGAGNGLVLLGVAAESSKLLNLGIQPDGKLLASGFCSENGVQSACIARLNGAPFGARQCSLDVDGDGLITATIDSLIHARLALGLRGDSVVNGITFPSNAKRNA